MFVFDTRILFTNFITFKMTRNYNFNNTGGYFPYYSSTDGTCGDPLPGKHSDIAVCQVIPLGCTPPQLEDLKVFLSQGTRQCINPSVAPTHIRSV